MSVGARTPGDATSANVFSTFYRHLRNNIRNCSAPGKKETRELIKGHLTGLVVLGLFGYVIKLVHLPINNIIAGSESEQ